MKITFLALLLSLPAFAQITTNEASVDTKPTLVTSQKLIVLSGSTSKFCGYLAGDTAKTPVCFPEEPALKQMGGVYDYVAASDAATCGHDKTSGVWTCWGFGTLFGPTVPNLDFLQGAKPSDVVVIADANLCRVMPNETIRCIYPMSWSQGSLQVSTSSNITAPKTSYGPFYGLRAASANLEGVCAIDAKGVECQLASYARPLPQTATFSNPRLISVGLERICVIDDSGLQCFSQSPSLADVQKHPEWARAVQVQTVAEGVCVVLPNGDGACDFPYRRSNAANATSYNSRTRMPMTFKNLAELTANSDSSSCARFRDGSVKCYGDLSQMYGAPPSLKQALNVSIASHHVCSADISGKAVCWGQNTHGQLRPSLPAGKPIQIAVGKNVQCLYNDKGASCSGEAYLDLITSVPALNNVAQLVLPVDGYNNDACAIDTRTDGSTQLVCWGPVPEFVKTPAISKSTILATNGQSACADRADGGITCWGAEGFENAPARSRRLNKIVMNEALACSIDAYGLSCWGPKADDLFKAPDELLTDGAVLDVALSRGKACALTYKHQVSCWGPKATTPPDLKNPIALSAYEDVMCATDDDGVKCWGSYPQVPGASLTPPRYADPRNAGP